MEKELNIKREREKVSLSNLTLDVLEMFLWVFKQTFGPHFTVLILKTISEKRSVT